MGPHSALTDSERHPTCDGNHFALRHRGRLVCVTAALSLTILLLLAGCGNEDPGPSSSVDRCSPDALRDSVSAFLAAANSGDEDALVHAVSGPDDFEAFSHGLYYGPPPGPFFSTDDPDALVDHLVARQERGDRMTLESLHPTGYDPRRELCNFGFVIERQVSGGPRRSFVGKGALEASSGSISVWNTGPTKDADR